MRIGYLVPDFPSQTHAFFWREALALREAGVTLMFFSTRRPPVSACPHDFGQEARAATTYLYPPPGSAVAALLTRPAGLARAIGYVLGLRETPVTARLKLLALIPCAMALAAACRSAGIAHAHIHSFANSAHIGALAAILDGLDYSLVLHGDLVVYGTDHARKMRRACLVATVTEPLRRQIHEIAPDREVPVIWMGVDTDQFRPLGKVPTDLKGHSLKVLSVTRLNRAKGHRYFLDAMARLAAEGVEIHYRIVGEGPERDAIEAHAAALGLAENVELLGAVSQDRVRALLQGSDVLALTSFGKGEAAPVAVMEAMASGTAVICSRIGGTTDMITDGEDGFLVAQKAPDEIAAVLHRLAMTPGLAARIGAAARTKAEACFDHRAQAGKLLQALRKTDLGETGV